MVRTNHSRRTRRGNSNAGQNILRRENEHIGPESFLCTLCNQEKDQILLSTCGHRFCKACIEDSIINTFTCPIDQKYICESTISNFLMFNLEDDLSMCSEGGFGISCLKARVDNLSLVMNRLVEHLTIRNMLLECHLEEKSASAPHPPQISSAEPCIVDSDESDNEGLAKQKLERAKQDVTCRHLNLSTLCDLPPDTCIDQKGVQMLINKENVRQLLPQFWKNATNIGWSDDEKLVRLHMLCDPTLQRLLDTKSLTRKDWPYVSALLCGDSVLDELGMITTLGKMHQELSETPHQWYVRVSGVVDRGLPPGPEREWEVRSSFLRGLHQKYRNALDWTTRQLSLPELIQRCSFSDVTPQCNGSNSSKNNDTNTRGGLFTNQSPGTRNNRGTGTGLRGNSRSNIGDNRACYYCGQTGHVVRHCPARLSNENSP